MFVLTVAGLLHPVAASAQTERAITLTFVRSAESNTNASNTVDTSVPGPSLSPMGYMHAQDAANQLRGNGYDGVYASTMVRAQETAAPLAAALNLPVTVLPGLRQIEAGRYEGQPEPESHETETSAWLAGDRSASIPGSITGDEFDARFDEAVQTIYDSGAVNPIAFSHSSAIMLWVLMNVTNPDNALYTQHPLPNLGRIEIAGNPRDGWTLTNWDGIPVPA
nr:phosphoglycerate mutase [Mycolicibacterium komanii]